MDVVDRLIKRMATGLSRRQFLKRLPWMGAGVGIVAAVSTAHASDCDGWWDYQNQPAYAGCCGSKKRYSDYRRCCPDTYPGAPCGSWEIYYYCSSEACPV